MKTIKRATVLFLFIIFNYNCTTMTSTCFNTNTYLELASLIDKSGHTQMLHERLVADMNEKAKEISFENFLLELVIYDTSSNIIIIDTKNNIPTYFCKIKDDGLYFSAYESRIDTEQDIQHRKDNWCELVSKILKE
ncbi:hypothetical protein [Kordia sp.]|uniref:hypothetical protein n=1 Tax=Kordia sp. TaxID=1965332 RepID=UPI003D6BF47D